ncbi:MAG TPA: hypothetical protein VMS21_00470 [Methylomirabilota bacterium]|nr:hypothetical protein [Methylomirabilota bacterium]
MTRWYQSIALLLLALWVPLTSHCLLEGARVLPSMVCCDEGGGDCGPVEPACEGDACGVVESALYKVDERTDAVFPFEGEELQAPVPAGASIVFEAGLVTVARSDVGNRGSIPWQFLVRAAMPVRAPTFLFF